MRDDGDDPELAPTVPSPDSDRAAVMAAETRTLAGGTKAPDAGPLPTSIDRYQIVGRIGEGGMGVVYEAIDPDLKRRVAVKVVRGRAGLIREAQAMAQLSHPSVVPVFDVGALPDGDGVFIAMELVEGETLRDWLKAEKRPWKQVVTKLVAAGRGLAAAHAAGIVHRDFKPANVLVGMDGRVRVTDFGLARVDETIDGAPVKDGETGIAGTPGYVAPEALDGVIDARVDQFAFCVSFYEALYGERPFDAGSGTGRSPLIAMAEEAKRTGVKPAPRGRDVPGWLRAMIVRGLDADPAKRWPSVSALLDAIEGVPRRRRNGLVAVATVTTLGGVVAIIALRPEATARGPAVCDGFDARLEGTWDGPSRVAAEAGLVRNDSAFARDTWSRVSARIDDYAETWVNTATQTCEAAEVRKEFSGAERDLRMRCLNQRLHSLGVLVRALAQADDGILLKAMQAVSDLPDITVCTMPELLNRFVVAPDVVVSSSVIDEVEVELATARLAYRLGTYAEGMALAERTASKARSAGLPALAADGEARAAILSSVMAQPGALERLQEASLAADAAGLDEVRLNTLYWIATHYLDSRQNERAAETIKVARAVYERLGRDAPRLLYAILANEKQLAKARGDLPLAVERGEQALALALRFDPHDPGAVGEARANLSGTLAEAGQHARAAKELSEGRAILAKWMGESHPQIGHLALNEGVLAFHRGELDLAAQHIREGISIVSASMGSDHPFVDSARMNLYQVLQMLGRNAEAKEVAEAGVASSARINGVDSANHAVWLTYLCNALVETGAYAMALETCERAEPIMDREAVPLDRALLVFSLGRALWLGERDAPRARKRLAEGVATYENAGGLPDEYEAWLRAQGLGALISKTAPPPDGER